MKSIYPKQSIVYLGQLEWNDAINMAVDCGMRVPNSPQMFELLKLPELKEFYNTKNTLTSTTSYMITSSFLEPVDKEKITKIQVENDTNLREAKTVKRHAFAVHQNFDMYKHYQFFKHPTA